MGRSRKLKLTNWSLANDRLLLYFEGNKSKLADHLKISRTTVTDFFGEKTIGEAKFRDICLALRLNWQEVSSIDEGDRSPSSQTSEEEEFERLVVEVRSRCCRKILYQHSTIQLLSQTEIGVDQLYVDVWLLDRSPRTFQISESTLLKSFDLRKDRLGLGNRVRRNEGISVANDRPRLLILGKPGAGKTTFLKHLAVECSNGTFQPGLIPVLIELRRIQSNHWKLLDAISEELALNKKQTEVLLEKSKLIIFMDGLDEVPNAEFRRNVYEQIRNIAYQTEYSGNRIILTCRTQVIKAISQGFTSVEVAEFNNEQVEQFVKNWFRANGLREEDIAQRWQSFSNATKTNPALNELTVTPVLLSLMCLILQDEGELPNQTEMLYRKGIRLLLERWNEHKEIPEWEIGNKVYQRLKPEQKEDLLTEIAVHKFENSNNFILFDQKVLAGQVAHFLNLATIQEGIAVLKAIEAQHGLLVERADELWSFSHLIFQEHFTIQWLLQLSAEQLAEKITNAKWREVIKQLVTYQPATKLLRAIKNIIDLSVSKEDKVQNFLTWVQEKSETVSTSYNLTAIRAFYFNLAFNLDRTLPLSLDLNCTLNLALDFDRAFDLDLDFDRTLTRALNHTFGLARACVMIQNEYPELQNKLQNLRNQLPNLSIENRKVFERWWQVNGDTWINQLRQLMITHRNIGHDWQFTSSQEQALQRYHDSNKFLVELLKRSTSTSDEVCQEIEDNLLLPIATLKQRLPDLYS